MSDVETIFSIDSLINIDVIKIINSDYLEFGEDTRWVYAIKIVDFFLDSFKLDIDFKILILEEYSISMIDEFSLGKMDKNNLNDFYRVKRNLIDLVIESKDNTLIDKILLKYSKMPVLINAINNILLLERDRKLEINFNSLIKSIIHMTNNRIFRTNQRQNELYIYYFMAKNLKSYKAKQNK